MALQLDIVTPEGERFSGEVDSVVLPGSEGEFEVLPGHERFLCPLKIGEVEIGGGEGERFAAMSEGFADVSDDHVTVLVRTCELGDDIDLARAEAARQRAEGRLKELDAAHREEVELHRVELALQRAVIRIQVAAKARSL